MRNRFKRDWRDPAAIQTQYFEFLARGKRLDVVIRTLISGQLYFFETVLVGLKEELHALGVRQGTCGFQSLQFARCLADLQ